MKLKRLLCVTLSVLLIVCSFSVVTSSATETKTTFNGRNVSVGDTITMSYFVKFDEVCEDFMGELTYGKNNSTGCDGIELVDYKLDINEGSLIIKNSQTGKINYNGVSLMNPYDFGKWTKLVTVTFRITKANANYYAKSILSLSLTDSTAIVFVDNGDRLQDDTSYKNEITITHLKIQTISAKSYTKVYGSGAFNLNAKAKTKLSYKSSNNSVATVSSSGKVTLKGVGKATITITAALSTTYKPATKNITVTVLPKPVTKVSTKQLNNKSIKVSWNNVPKATFYKFDISSSSKFNSKDTYTYFVTDNSILCNNIRKTMYARIVAAKSDKYDSFYSSAKIIKISPPVTVKPVPSNSIKFKQSGSNINLTWGKVSGANGYNFKISANSNGNKANYEKNITKTSLKLRNAKKGQKIKFSIRAYKKSNSKTYYSSWTTKTFVVR